MKTPSLQSERINKQFSPLRDSIMKIFLQFRTAIYHCVKIHNEKSPRTKSYKSYARMREPLQR